MSAARLASCVLGVGVLAGCPAAISDPAPPPRQIEIVSAPPRALGAMAAGTDAAPRPDRSLGGLVPSLPLPHGGGLAPAPDGSAEPGTPGATPEGLAPAPPDAGMAL